VGVAYPPDTLTPGFARENLTKPPETAAVSALVKPVSAAHVAARWWTASSGTGARSPADPGDRPARPAAARRRAGRPALHARAVRRSRTA
jgi:hypothetical protein